mgnify:CR=1 FL=1
MARDRDAALGARGGEEWSALARAVLPRVGAAASASLEELQQRYGEGNKDGVLPIIAISFCTHARPPTHQVSWPRY